MQLKIASRKNIAKCFYLFAALIPGTTMATQLAPIDGVPSKPLDQVLGSITDWLIGFGLLLCVVMIVWGSINYIGAVGDEERIKRAKKTVHYAVFGILIIGLSYAIIKVVNDVLT